MENENKIERYYKKYKIFTSLKTIIEITLCSSSLVIVFNIVYFIINFNKNLSTIDDIANILSYTNDDLIAQILGAILIILILLKYFRNEISFIVDSTIDKNSMYYKKISSKSFYYTVIIATIISPILIFYIIPRILIFIILKSIDFFN
ncbi:MAG: hypothetical protein NUV32_10375 [Exilispira sp.]|jgi:hypothetical protein|nr:hypothetical protein [Exilispira sp.]